MAKHTIFPNQGQARQVTQALATLSGVTFPKRSDSVGNRAAARVPGVWSDGAFGWTTRFATIKRLGSDYAVKLDGRRVNELLLDPIALARLNPAELTQLNTAVAAAAELPPTWDNATEDP